jgi:ABC-type uncharacterized transport system substrate-binding protein
VTSLQQPGGNITGSSDALPDALATRLQLLLRTAKALGITIPPDVLSAADEVIQ